MESGNYAQGGRPRIAEIDKNSIKFLQVLDRGSFGTVSLAVWNGENVAVKVFDTHEEKDAFKTEVDVLANVSHPNIIELYGMVVGETCMIVMELATQNSLYNLLHRRLDIPYKKEHMVSWWYEIADAIGYLHSHKPKPITHRDLKSSNILLKDDHIKVCDFGTACDVRSLMSNAKGTVSWMAPEVIVGETYNERCDVYSFGLVMWEILMRRVPFKGLNPFQVMQAVSQKKQRPPLPETIPRCIRTIIVLCWNHEPHIRPDFEALLDILSHLMGSVAELDIQDPPTGEAIVEEVDVEEVDPILPPQPHTPEVIAPGPSSAATAVPSPPRFPITPGSCSPSPTTPLSSSTPSGPRVKSDEIAPYPHCIANNPESTQLYSLHCSVHEELQILNSHLRRKESVYKSLSDKLKESKQVEVSLNAQKEERQLRLTILKSENETMHEQLNYALDNP